MDAIYSTIPGYAFATIYEMKVEPTIINNVYHGTNLVTPENCQEWGFPAKGTDIDLVRHAEPPPTAIGKSAFIGSCPFPRAPGYDAGAVCWAGEGGWVYHINSWPGYDLNLLLEGQIRDGKGGFRGLLHPGEQETALPAKVPKRNIVKIGRVERLRGGLAVKWIGENDYASL